MLWPTQPAVPRLTLRGKLKQLHKITEQATRLKRRLLQEACSLIYLVSINLDPGDHGSNIHSKYWELSCF